jgi:hypothetical protein
MQWIDEKSKSEIGNFNRLYSSTSRKNKDAINISGYNQLKYYVFKPIQGH